MIQHLKRLSGLLAFVVAFSLNLSAQDDSASIAAVPRKYLGNIDRNTRRMNDRITRQTVKYIQRIAREERRLKSKISKLDKQAALQVFSGTEEKFRQWQTELTGSSLKSNQALKKYIPVLDTLQTALEFLTISEGQISTVTPDERAPFELINQVSLLKGRLEKTEEISKYLKARKQLLAAQLGRFGLTKDLEKYSRQLYYYQLQLQEYKKVINDPSLWETKALELLKQTTVFRNFFSNHSELAGMFNLPGSSTENITASFAGLQTRDEVRQMMLQRAGGPGNLSRIVHQQMPTGQSALNKLKDKINELGGSSSDIEKPDFKPNNQKVKQLKDRLEFGTNLQTVNSNRFFPSTSDLGLSLGYKLNDKSVVGVGGSYKIGWGKDIRHVSLTHQGIGIRSFFDYKIKDGFWLSGGGEMNYRNQIKNFEALRNYSSWQSSALVGVSKKYQVSKKLKGNAQLMYDLLWKEQIPRTQPLLFRVGYNLK